MEVDLTDSVAVVTGSTAGIGRTIAIELADQNARVIVNWRSDDRCTEVVEAILAEGGTAEYQSMDINDYDEVQRGMASIVDRHGKIDIFVPNGAAAAGPVPTFFEETDPKDFLDFAENTLVNRLYCIKATLEGLKAADDARVVNISADAGRIPTPGEIGPGTAAAGLMMGTKILASELGRWGIAVNTVSLSVVDGTPAYKWAIEESPIASVLEEASERQDFEVRSEDVAEVVAFLAGADCARAITGQLVSFNGGLSYPG